MHREPSIHIDRTHLVMIIEECLELGVISIDSESSSDDVVDYLLSSGKKYQLTHRKLLADKSVSAKASKIGSSNLDKAYMFSKSIHMYRKTVQKISHAKAYKEKDREWPQLKECVSYVDQFCQDFDLPFEEGVKIYTRILLTLMGKKFGVNRISFTHEKVYNTYQAENVIKLDKLPDDTEEFHHAYLNTYFEYTGIPIKSFRDKPEIYCNFVWGREAADEWKVSYSDYMRSQFEGLQWANAAPEPSQLHGDKSEERLRKYMFKVKGKKSKQVDAPSSSNTTKLNWEFLNRSIDDEDNN